MINKDKVNQRNMQYKDSDGKTYTMFVTEWKNGDGWDIAINNDESDVERLYSLSDVDFSVLSILIQSFNVNSESI